MTGQWTFSLASLSNRSACARTANGAQDTSWRCEQLNFDWYNQQVIQRKNGNSNVYSASLLLRFGSFPLHLFPRPSYNKQFICPCRMISWLDVLCVCAVAAATTPDVPLPNWYNVYLWNSWHKFPHLFESATPICTYSATGKAYQIVTSSMGKNDRSFRQANPNCRRFEKMLKFMPLFCSATNIVQFSGGTSGVLAAATAQTHSTS